MSEYLKAAEAAGLKWPDIADWGEEQLREAAAPSREKTVARKQAPEPDYAAWPNEEICAIINPATKPPDPTKPLPECNEGPEAFQHFDAIMTKLLSVSKATLLERERKYRKKVDANPHRPGPRRKVKRAGS